MIKKKTKGQPDLTLNDWHLLLQTTPAERSTLMSCLGPAHSTYCDVCTSKEHAVYARASVCLNVRVTPHLALASGSLIV